ncbi:methylthioribulose 1-phosphate dehydratase [Paenibacillus glucanolyticus]|jgi:methylthioribulose-1-phosphate dehydratase|uniref:methylthioribulose 1-phosphate dehydratase n=1 Tax=Paenibacillus TaxID=44249 RepID=UPI0003E24147|nr:MULTISPECIES: methylthioribulose 1-phosphate dehydratase [Paenibacillus]ANA82091.1 methylthioribulose-1-phosphate dehydratase [Paenibacillus glucanolyticus]AVV59170.1 methylthioribulose 1-phosphate dehydratase [Paenibacillus glucanolyticus]ETT43536.1 methylthioribulose-1-phosphate dehydratase [Paenibacillus sp. FSL R5-808]MPY16312.1 methylthioribulose 1-phosphate dehydratase [Paenibacillus glucanolyticus]
MAFSDIPLEQKQAALHDLKEIKALFAARNWFPGTSGNLSVRVGEFSPEQFYFAVTASGKDKSVHTPEDYLFVDQDGAPSEATGLKPSAETLIHCEIYRKTGCGAIFHVHTIDNNLISDWYGEQGYVPAQGIELIKAFNIWDEDAAIRIPVLPNYADIPRIAELVPDTLDPAVPGILLRNHGIYAWGKNAFEAKKHLEAFEFIFEYSYRRLLLNAASTK